MNNRKARGKWLLGGLLLAGQAALAGELYRWVDQNGKVHFGDRPPLEAKAENIGDKLRPINSADALQRQSTGAHQNESNPEQEYIERQRRRQQAQQQQRINACNTAQRQLQMLQGRVAFIDESGKEIKMTERERQQLASQLQSEINRVCS